jgi:hypothetical protein
MARNFLWKLVGTIHVNSMTKSNPTIAEWDEMLAEFQHQVSHSQIQGILVYTEGGAPNALQRKRLRESHLTNGTTLPKSALLTNSLVARAAMTAINLFFDNKFKAFSPVAIDDALRYLGAPEQAWPELKRVLAKLTDELKIENRVY